MSVQQRESDSVSSFETEISTEDEYKEDGSSNDFFMMSCFCCGKEEHQPCDCETVRCWTEKCRNDYATAKWMRLNTTQCPMCHIRIVKNQGYSHMTCSQCHHEFGLNGDVDWNTGTSELDDFIHYSQHFQTQGNNLRFAINRYNDIKAFMDNCHERSSLEELQFILDAAELVISCRRILKYTFVLGFYMEKDAGCRPLFECHQEMLMENTDKLQCLHTKHNKDLRKLDRQEVLNLTRTTERFRDSLLSTLAANTPAVAIDTATAAVI